MLTLRSLTTLWPHLWGLPLPKPRTPVYSQENHQTNPNWGTHCVKPDQCSSKPSQPPRTSDVWDSVTHQRRRQTHNQMNERRILPGVLGQKRNPGQKWQNLKKSAEFSWMNSDVDTLIPYLWHAPWQHGILTGYTGTLYCQGNFWVT